MIKDLPNYEIDRQNISNNGYAISEIEKDCNDDKYGRFLY